MYQSVDKKKTTAKYSSFVNHPIVSDWQRQIEADRLQALA